MKKGSINTFIFTLKFGRPYAGSLLLVSLLNLIAVSADLSFLYLLKKLIDTGFTSQHISLLQRMVLYALGILILRSILVYSSGYLSTYINRLMTNNIQNTLYSKIQTLSLDFHTENSTGNILTLIYYHTDEMLKLITSMSGTLAKELFRIPALILFLFYLHHELTLFSLLVLPPAFFSVRLFKNRITRTTQKSYDVLSKLYTKTERTLSHMETIKTFDKELEEIEYFKNLNDEMLSRSIQVYKASALSGPVIQMLKMLGITILVFLGTLEVSNGDLSMGGLTTFLASTYYFYGGLSSITDWYLSLIASLVSAEKVIDVLKTEPSILSPTNGKILDKFENEIILKDISFRYPSSKTNVLKKISFCIKKGKTLAITGPSGSGKSTLIKLLLRLYDPFNGTILVDGHTHTDINLSSLRKLYGVAPQDPGIFQDSIAEAISYGKLLPLDEIQKAAKIAGAHDFIIQLSKGYDSLIGERSVKLSGGEKQRLSLARAILLNPEILILDEALSSIDAPMEKAILQRISFHRRNKTTILISHRLKSITHSDCIILIEQGSILHEGSHQKLMTDSNRYREWYETFV